MKFLGIVTIVIAAGLLTTTAGADLSSAPAGVQYQWSGSFGTLTVLGAAGQDIEVYDAGGNPVAAGTLAGDFEVLPAFNTGESLDGSVLYVSVGGQWTAVGSTEWEWLD